MQALFIKCPYLFKQDDGIFFKAFIAFCDDVGGELCFDVFHARNCCHNDRSAVLVSFIIGDDKYGSVFAALLRAKGKQAKGFIPSPVSKLRSYK